ncbi:MAG: hypothetical protein JF591_23750, partial [Lysobacter sp.]|nr:hypothetical protein [Lysobacter sp.]
MVCGCGPSLLELPRPHDLLTIGVNDVGRLFDPTYLVVLNPRQQFKGDRYAFVERSNAHGGVDAEADGALHYSQNSPYVAVRLAALMGARRIGLIGVDFTDDHFFAMTGRHSLAGRLKEIDAQYGRLGAALRRGGVELINLSSISRLTALPRGRIDDAGWYERPAPTASAARVAASTKPVALPAPAPARIAQARSPSMKVAIEKRSAGLVGDLLDTLARSAAELGHTVVRDPRGCARNPRVLSIVWNGRGYSTAGPTLYCEH